MTKLDITTRSSIAMSIVVMNIACLAAHTLRLFLMIPFSRSEKSTRIPVIALLFHGW